MRCHDRLGNQTNENMWAHKREGCFPLCFVLGSYGSAVRVQEQYDPGCGKPGDPPAASKWGLLPGLARQPVFITNVTLQHHSNASFFNLRGFWTVTSSNVRHNASDVNIIMLAQHSTRAQSARRSWLISCVHADAAASLLAYG